jgi:hypothetical protein
MTRITSIAAAVAVVVMSLGILASRGAAHESRTVGPYTFVVGWSNEPAIAGQSNGLDLTVTQTAGGTPVDGLENSLHAEVIVGGGAKTRSLPLAPDSDKPGHYTSGFVPTRTGDYAFHITGTAGTTTIDEKFESGPNRFDAVTDIAPLEFPDQVPAAADLAKQLADANSKLNVAIALGALALAISIGSAVRTLRRR